jgi:alkylation response protein AidB-like acyl-CoA dehydrogenase
MDAELGPVTEPGAHLVKLAEEHAEDFATRADTHDRDGSFPVENFAAMQESGLLAACVPVELGGLGVESIHDLTVAVSRLARGDASTAIGTSMHVSPPWGLTRAWRDARSAGFDDMAAVLERFLRQMGAQQMLLSIALTEPGTTLLHPLTEATPVDGGFIVSGHKAFATNAPLANVFMVSARAPSEAAAGDHEHGLVVVFVPRDSAGLAVRETWDAMGMRASCSHDVVLDHCFVPSEMAMPLGVWGRWDTPFLSLTVPGSYPLLGAFLGIAEAARATVIDMVTTRRKAPSGRTLAERHSIQHVIAEVEINLSAARATLARTAVAIDEHFARCCGTDLTADGLHSLFAQHQCANVVVKEAAIRVVDLAMTASGGGGYLRSSPISRHYRDVRAGPFMQPYSPLEAYEYIGRIALGLDPELEG